MKDLVAVFKVLNVCADRVETHPLYIEPMCEILHICRLPFFKEKTSDETSYKQIAVESLSQLGKVQKEEFHHHFHAWKVFKCIQFLFPCFLNILEYHLFTKFELWGRFQLSCFSYILFTFSVLM